MYSYDGPPRICHSGHVYYNHDVMQSKYELPRLSESDRERSRNKDPLDVIISGGSMGGLFTAVALLQAGHKPVIYEKTHEGDMADRGAGIIAHPEMLYYLDDQNIANWDDICTFTSREEHLDVNGNVISKEGYITYTSSWSIIYNSLRQSIPDSIYKMGNKVDKIEIDNDSISVKLDNNQFKSADLFVCAEGYRSPNRHHIVGEKKLRYAGYVAFRGVVPESELINEYESRFGDIYNIFHASDSQFLTYPVPAGEGLNTKGERLINWVWYYPIKEREELDNLMLDINGCQRSHSLPPGYMRTSIRNQAILEPSENLPQSMKWLVNSTQEPFVQVIYDMANSKLVNRRACLVGDAAFSVRPHMGAGTAHAAADALKLGECLFNSDSIEHALNAWEIERVAKGYDLFEESVRRGNRYCGYYL